MNSEGETPEATEALKGGEKSAPAGTSLGGGGVLLGSAKLAFLLGSYLTSTLLAWIWSNDLATFGDYQVIARLIAVPNMVIIQTMLFAVSRPLAAQYAEGLPAYGPLRRRGFKLALGLGGLISLGFFLGAGPIARWGLGDAQLAWPIRAVSPIAFVYALYAVNVGSLNASRRFAHQAGLDMFMAAAKCGLILGAAVIGLGLAFTLAGFTAASVLALALSAGFVLWTRPPASREAARTVVPPIAPFAGVLILFTLAANSLQSADLLVLKRLTAVEAKDVVGSYSSALLVGMVPYSLMNAVALLMFPLIATLHAAQDAAGTRRYVSETLRVTCGLLVFMSVVGWGCAADILALIFPAEYAARAAEHLRLLVWGFSGYSFVITSGWILNSAQRSRWAIGLVAGTLLVVVVAAFFWIEAAGPNGAARACALAGGAGTVAALLVHRKIFGAGVAPLFLLKLALSCCAAAAVAHLWQVEGRPLILVKLTAVSGAFLAVAAATRAVTIDQLKALRRAT